MAEVIDLVAYLRRKKLVEFLTKGITIDLDEQMSAEFQYLLECFLTETFEELTFCNEGDDTLTVKNLNQDIMYLHFDNRDFYVTLPNDVDLTNPNIKGFLGGIASASLSFWEAFENEIPFIQQSFL